MSSRGHGSTVGQTRAKLAFVKVRLGRVLSAEQTTLCRNLYQSKDTHLTFQSLEAVKPDHGVPISDSLQSGQSRLTIPGPGIFVDRLLVLTLSLEPMPSVTATMALASVTLALIGSGYV